jgi:hypothetical protein
MNINKTYIKGKYICPLLGFIWLITILCIVAYIVSWLNAHLLKTTLLFNASTFINIAIILASVIYNPIDVKDI